MITTNPSTPTPFGQRLRDAMNAKGQICAGIDPHAQLLDAWGLPDTVNGLREFTLTALDALAPVVAAIKPQSAFYERHGSAGIAVLEEAIAAARARNVLCIVDAKRGDIGSTMNGYAQAYLDSKSPLAADAVTLSPYLGPTSLTTTARFAHAQGRGIFVLALTSNPEGHEVQQAIAPNGSTVAKNVAAMAAATNAQLRADIELGPVGLVIGATLPGRISDRGIDLAALQGAILAPGIGAQGAGPQDLTRLFGETQNRVLASVSRSVLAAGPNAAALREAAEQIRDLIGAQT